MNISLNENDTLILKDGKRVLVSDILRIQPGITLDAIQIAARSV